MHETRRVPRLPPVYLLGPAFVAAIAYVDPGNVAANISAGAQFGFLLVWVIVLVTTGFVGLATMLTAVALPIWLLISGLDGQLPLLVFLTGLALFIVFTHRANIRRLRAGNENRIERAMLLRRRPR